MEITESAIMEQVEVASSGLSNLKSLGIKLSMDDFGKGYSSLSYLHQFPFDTLKIDRSFIAVHRRRRRKHGDRADDHLARQGLGLDVIAEGVETENQLLQLKDLGCQFGQGYLFSRPLNAEAAGALLRENPRWFEPSSQDVPAIARVSHSETISSRSFMPP